MAKKWTVKEIKNKLDDDTLDLSLCDLEEVPVKEIAQVKRFTRLDLSNNALVTLPKTLTVTITQIIKLDLSKNMLTDLPDNIGDLRMLKHLDLYSNKISRLPLSLGNLKNLKWLDLKDNPLTPAVASIAGPCSNASECALCAKKIVSYLTNVKNTVEQEKQRRIEAVQETEKIAAMKKEAKKKKKEAKKAAEKAAASAKKEVQENNVPKSPTVIDDYSDETKDSYGFCGRMCTFMTTIIFSLFFTMCFMVLLLVVLHSYKQAEMDAAVKNVESAIGFPIAGYYYEGMRLLEPFIDKAKLWTNHSRDYLEKTYQKYFPEETFQKKKF